MPFQGSNNALIVLIIYGVGLGGSSQEGVHNGGIGDTGDEVINQHPNLVASRGCPQLLECAWDSDGVCNVSAMSQYESGSSKI